VDLNALTLHLDRFTESLKKEDQRHLRARLQSLTHVYPFNQYEYTLMFLVSNGAISFADYETLRDQYASGNQYRELFGLAPRIFGQIWGEKHLMDLDNRFVKATKLLDPNYSGQYDLWINGARIEVKAARAIDTKHRGELITKALRSDSPQGFWMNFQQIKFDVADVFIFIGVWVDKIAYWVVSNDEIKVNPYLSHQHRGGIEYQIGITHKNIRDFDPYLCSADLIGDMVLTKYAQANPSGLTAEAA
jgi:hypothetical protein